jgi:hypothetical protein
MLDVIWLNLVELSKLEIFNTLLDKVGIFAIKKTENIVILFMRCILESVTISAGVFI